MTKKEIIWRDILHRAVEQKTTEFTQKELARRFGFSLSTVFNALKVPRQAGAIRVTGKGFRVLDAEKFLMLWATHRNLKKEIAYKTTTRHSAREAEGAVPPSVVFACCGAYRKKYGEEPADYDKVFVYADEAGVREVKKRFPPQQGYDNLIVLKSDPYLSSFGHTTPDVQTFVDLWNLEDWYAKEFLNALKSKMFSYA